MRSVLIFLLCLGIAGCGGFKKGVKKAGSEVKKDFRLDADPANPDSRERQIEEHGEP